MWTTRVTERLVAQLIEGKAIALISDAGTPLVSDPGFRLVRAAQDAQCPVVPLPGPCAAITALSALGLPTDRFAFEGFLTGQSRDPARPVCKLSVSAITRWCFMRRPIASSLR